MLLTIGGFMRTIKLIITHTLQPHHPSIIEIDDDDLNEVIHDAIDGYLDELAEEDANSDGSASELDDPE